MTVPWPYPDHIVTVLRPTVTYRDRTVTISWQWRELPWSTVTYRDLAWPTVTYRDRILTVPWPYRDRTATYRDRTLTYRDRTVTYRNRTVTYRDLAWPILTYRDRIVTVLSPWPIVTIPWPYRERTYHHLNVIINVDTATETRRTLHKKVAQSLMLFWLVEGENGLNSIEEDYLTGSWKVTLSVAQIGLQWWREVLRRHSGVDPSESSFAVFFSVFLFSAKTDRECAVAGGLPP